MFGATRSELVEAYGEDNVWNTKELAELFTVHSFLAPYVYVTSKSDGVKGTVQFIHDPRNYYNFVAD